MSDYSDDLPGTGPLFVVGEERDEPYRVTVETVTGVKATRYFEDHDQAREFFEQAEKKGVQIGQVRFSAKALRVIVFEGREGLIVRPPPATILPRRRML